MTPAASLPLAVQAFLDRRPRAALYRAPGRINLIGEHTDYNEGWVLPAASSMQLWFAVEPAALPEWRLTAGRFGETVALPVRDCLIDLHHWSRYAAAVLHTATAHGLPVPGMDVAFDGDLPAGAGMSSSSALTCALLQAASDLGNWGLSKTELTLLARESEHRTGVLGGIMDQYTIFHARPGQALLLDCRSLEARAVPAGNWEWVLCHSGVTHELVHSEYNQRRASCQRVVNRARQDQPGVLALRDLSPADLSSLSGELSPDDLARATYVLEENQRVHRMAQALQEGDVAAAGMLLQAGHAGLRDQYQVSCPELDYLADRLLDVPGVAGARLMGGGFGGGVLALLHGPRDEAALQSLCEEYDQQYARHATIYPQTLSGALSREA